VSATIASALVTALASGQIADRKELIMISEQLFLLVVAKLRLGLK
jgi:hypothetical protein